MPIQTRWHGDNQDTLIVEFPEKWTVTEFLAVLSEIRSTVDNLPGVYNVIFDFSRTSVSGTPDKMFEVAMRPNIISPNRGYVILVAINEIISVGIPIAVQVIPSLAERLHVTRTLDEALQLLERLRRAASE
jgi:hypothetical protein